MAEISDGFSHNTYHHQQQAQHSPVDEKNDEDSEIHDATSTTPKLPPCDQCRRRKVKCDGRQVPCLRCIQSHLTCTRDIARKKRGPKKGSGSVIAKLRDEHDFGVSHNQVNGLPPFEYAQMEMQMPTIRTTHDSPLSSPLASPLGSQFGDVYTPTSDPSTFPRSVPATFQNSLGMEHGLPAGFAQGGVHFPSAWQLSGSELLQLHTPTSPNGYITVKDLERQIFHQSPGGSPHLSAGALQVSPQKLGAQIIRPNSIGALLTSSTNTTSPATTASNSPLPSMQPRFLYRSDSSNTPVENRISSLADEVGMSGNLMSQCIRQYFRNLYPIMPIIHMPSFNTRMSQSDELSIDEKVLVLSMCAITLTHSAPPSDLTLESRFALSRQFLEFCFQLRRSFDWTESATLASIQASYHICNTMFELKKPRSHHFFLREAIGMAFDQNLHLEHTYANMTEIEAICARRTLALLFVTERGLSILRNKPITIIKLPYVTATYFDENDRLVLAGFAALTNLFSVLDEKFVNLWRLMPGEGTPGERIDNIAAIQHELNNLTFNEMSLTDVQKADVFITHQWLRLIFWQASMRQGLITSSTTDPAFQYNYPMIIAKHLCQALERLPYDAISFHGLGIFEKIFEITYSLMDALTIAKLHWSGSPELKRLFQYLSANPNSHNTYVKMLETKMDAERSHIGGPDGSNG